MSDLIDQYRNCGFVPTVKVQIYCPQCGEVTEELHEGYCEECFNQNQAELERHIAQYDNWQRMNDEERNEAIMHGCT